MEYVATKAHHKKYARRKYCKITLKKIKSHPELERYIREKIKEKDWSPETVSELWNKQQKEKFPEENEEERVLISWKTIYQYCYSVW